MGLSFCSVKGPKVPELMKRFLVPEKGSCGTKAPMHTLHI